MDPPSPSSLQHRDLMEKQLQVLQRIEQQQRVMLELMRAQRKPRIKARKGKPPGHIQKLDDDILLAIFHALPLVKDIARAACVCKRWNTILGVAAKIISRCTRGLGLASSSIKRLHIHSSNLKTIPVLCSKLAQLQSAGFPNSYLHTAGFHGLKSPTSVSFFSPKPQLQASAPDLHPIFSSIVKIEFSCCTISPATARHLALLPNLARLSFDDCSETDPEDSLLSRLQAATALRDLSFRFSLSNHPESVVTEREISSIAQLTSLTSLTFEEVCLPTSSLRLLSSLSLLQRLWIIHTRFDSPPEGITTEFDFISSLTALTEISTLESCEAIRGMYPSLPSLTSLKTLSLECWEGEDVQVAAPLAALNALTITTVMCSDRETWEDHFAAPDFASLASISRLQSLTLYTVGKLPIECVGPLLQALPHLTYLYLSLGGAGHSEYGDIALGHMGGLKQLQQLEITYPDFSPSGLDCLIQLSQLTLLKFENAHDLQLTAEHMRRLACIRSLEDVGLGHSQVTYDGLCWLRHMPRLKRVKMDGAVPDGAKQALPPGVLCSR